jgi:hypothetical protein
MELIWSHGFALVAQQALIERKWVICPTLGSEHFFEGTTGRYSQWMRSTGQSP